MLLIRADANSKLGSGHVMRCAAIAREVESRNVRVLFAVSESTSAELVAAQGLDSVLVGGDSFNYSREDAKSLVDVARRFSADTILVDSYAANEVFLSALSGLAKRGSIKTAYMDDLFTYERGYLRSPIAFPVDLLINYGLSARKDAYDEAYNGTDTETLIGPRFAPVREEFRRAAFSVSDSVESVLVTCGSTNQHCFLEQVVSSCVNAVPNAIVNVVVGPQARYDQPESARVRIHRNVSDMASLMAEADIAVSAAGSTLYELAAIGMPTLALPMVENQIPNAIGFSETGLGLSVPSVSFDIAKIESLLADLAANANLRKKFSQAMRAAVDGSGAVRIGNALCSSMQCRAGANDGHEVSCG